MRYNGYWPYNERFRIDMNPTNMMNQGMNDAMNPNLFGVVELSEALDLIVQALGGETEDRLFYEYLMNNAPSLMDKEIIRGIRDDEIKHYKMFRQIYYEHTGKVIQPEKNAGFEPPTSYCEGLKGALLGELNAVKKYRRILAAMKDRRHINILTEIITDEIRHANLYNLLIHNNDCKY